MNPFNRYGESTRSNQASIQERQIVFGVIFLIIIILE